MIDANEAPGIFDGIAEDTYHAHRALSQSTLKTLLDCPARFRYEQEHPKQVGEAADLGTAVHGLVLGGGYEVTVVQATDWRTKAAQEARKEAAAHGRVALLASAYDTALTMAEAVLANPVARMLLEAEGGSEQSLFWNKAYAGQVVPLRGRLDKAAALSTGTILADLKTARSASPRFFAGQALNYGYHIQQAVYRDGWEVLTGERPEFRFIVVESAPPHLTTVYSLDDVLTVHGEREYERALGLFLECQSTGIWPGYPGGVLEAPGWLRHQVRNEDEVVGGDPWAETYE